MADNIFQLPDGRNLCYTIYGPGDGEPVLYFHGTPSSRLEPRLLNAYLINLDELLFKKQVRLIAVDRPGMGLSTFNANGNFTTFAKDVSHLANYLNIKKCKVLCWSGGGPYALTIACKHPELISAVFIITGFTQSFSEPNVFKEMHANKYYFGAAKYVPWLMKPIMNFIGKQQAEKPLPQKISQLPDVDQNLLKYPMASRLFTNVTMNEACLNGSEGIVHEARLYFNPYDFTLKDIKRPVHFWWGNKDNVVTRTHPEALAKNSANSMLHYKENEGHLSVYVHYFEEVLDTIKAG